MLGKELLRVLMDRDTLALDRQECDITDENALRKAISAYQPDVVINATAFTDVNRAEREQETANQVNGYAVGNLAKLCREFGATLVHFSSNFVFNGENRDGYDEEAVPAPINAYGRSKLLGEQLIMDAMEADFPDSEIGKPGKYFIIRTSYLFGAHGDNFIARMKSNMSKTDTFKAVQNQESKLTYALDLAKQTKWLIECNEYESGIYHVTNGEKTTFYNLARVLVEEAGFVSVEVVPCSMDEWVNEAKRPQYSVLINKKIPELRSWKEAFRDYLEELKAP